MMKIAKVGMAALLALGLGTVAKADLNIQWQASWGFVMNTEADLSGNPGTGLLANNGSGSTILQLIWVGANGVLDEVNPFNAGFGYVGGDDQVLQTRNISNGVGGYDEFGFNGSPPGPYTDAAWGNYGSAVYTRIFQDATPGLGEYYFDSDVLTILNRPDSTPANSQVLNMETGDGSGLSQSTQLNKLIVPEPSVLAFLGAGALVVAIRRMRRS